MGAAFDFKKEYKDLYLPKNKPILIDIPAMQFIAVEGKGDPNEENGEYSAALGILYAVQYTIKMSKKGAYTPNGYFDYVVPPLEGLWWFEGSAQTPPPNKTGYNWLSLIRLPDFVDNAAFEWACANVTAKKHIDTAKARLFTLTEGLCVQCMHIGIFDDEAKTTIPLIHQFIEDNNLIQDINDTRRHHEIYLSDPRKGDPANLKTVLRIPVRRKE